MSLSSYLSDRREVLLICLSGGVFFFRAAVPVWPWRIGTDSAMVLFSWNSVFCPVTGLFKEEKKAEVPAGNAGCAGSEISACGGGGSAGGRVGEGVFPAFADRDEGYDGSGLGKPPDKPGIPGFHRAVGARNQIAHHGNPASL